MRLDDQELLRAARCAYEIGRAQRAVEAVAMQVAGVAIRIAGETKVALACAARSFATAARRPGRMYLRRRWAWAVPRNRIAFPLVADGGGERPSPPVYETRTAAPYEAPAAAPAANPVAQGDSR